MDKKTAVQELMELNTFLKIMGVTIEWDKYLEKEKEQIIDAYEDGKQNGIESITNVNKYTIGEYYYNQTYENGEQSRNIY